MCSTEGLDAKATIDNNTKATSVDIATTAIWLRPNLDPPAMNTEPRSFFWLSFCAPFNADAETSEQTENTLKHTDASSTPMLAAPT
jgi:hypothetical protein